MRNNQTIRLAFRPLSAGRRLAHGGPSDRSNVLSKPAASRRLGVGARTCNHLHPWRWHVVNGHHIHCPRLTTAVISVTENLARKRTDTIETGQVQRKARHGCRGAHRGELRGSAIERGTEERRLSWDRGLDTRARRSRPSSHGATPGPAGRSRMRTRGSLETIRERTSNLVRNRSGTKSLLLSAHLERAHDRAMV